MSWMQKLCDVYDSAIETNVSKQERKVDTLIPVGFIRKNIKYRVVLDEDGEFVTAVELAKDSQEAMIPSTPQAEGRTGAKGPAFPLADQLQYLLYDDGLNPKFNIYIDQLKNWANDEDSPKVLQKVVHYLERKSLYDDMANKAHLKIKNETTGKITELKALVCFSVFDSECIDGEEDLWKRNDIKASWYRYFMKNMAGQKDLCFISGEQKVILENHPKVQGNAKLISAKDAEFPFLYKGRFVNDHSSATVSYDVAARAYSALAWLMSRKGTINRYGITLLAWNTNTYDVKSPLYNEDFFETDFEDEPDTFLAYSDSLRKAAFGIKNEISKFSKNQRSDEVIVMALEAATDGRMSITYYQEFPGGSYIDKITQWYSSCCWLMHDFHKGKNVIKTPSTNQIAVTVLGSDTVKIANDDAKGDKNATKIMRKFQYRILPCILENRNIPEDMIKSAYKMATNPLAFKKDNSWDYYAWKNCVETTCALIHRFNNESGDKPVLDRCNTNCEYLYGRLLAVADWIEHKAAQNKAGDTYITNAIRLMKQFSKNPLDTWKFLHLKLIPYLNEDTFWLQRELEEISALLLNAKNKSNENYRFLQGYYCQRYCRTESIKNPELPKKWKLPENRDQLYGCLLAVADMIEINCERTSSNNEGIEKVFGYKITQGLRHIGKFEQAPGSTWQYILERLIPYYKKIKKIGVEEDYSQYLLRQIESKFMPKDREADVPLSAEYLLSYYCTRFYLLTKEYELDCPFNKVFFDLEVLNNRNYLYGQLLGIADRVEKAVLESKKNEVQTTNAFRSLSTYSRMPQQTWEYLKVKIRPYVNELGTYGDRCCRRIEELESHIYDNGFNKNDSLNAVFIYYYYAHSEVKKGELR